MSDFKAKMHQIVCRLGLRPRPRWGSLQRSPRPSSWLLGPPLHNKRFTMEEIIKIVATRCQILRLRCTKSLTALPQTPQLDFREITSTGGEMTREEGRGREGRVEKGREGKRGEGRGMAGRRGAGMGEERRQGRPLS